MTDATITPYLGFHDCAAAIEFYIRAFDAVETGARFTDSDGKVGHAEITIGQSVLFMSDEYPDYGALSPHRLGGSHAALHLRVGNVDRIAKQAVAAGAKVLRELTEQTYGERSGTFLDPFGYRWMLSEHIEDVAKDELQRRVGDQYHIT